MTMAVIVGNHIYIATRLNEVTDPYKFLLNVNSHIPLNGIYNGIAQINSKFSIITMAKYFTDTGFHILDTKLNGNLVYFKCKKIENL